MRAERGFTVRLRSAEHGFTARRRSAKHGFTARRRSAEHGFTLIEVMVALAVFSLAVLALVRLENATIRGSSTLDGSLVGDMVARNVAIDAATDARAPTLGVVQGAEVNGGRTWTWTRTVTPTGDPRIVTIAVSVADPHGQVLGRATLVRPPDPVAGS